MAITPEPEASDGTVAVPDRKSDEERKFALTQHLRMLIAGGSRIESQNDYDAVVATGKEVNHTLHLIVTLVTCGIWGLVWIGIAVTGGVKREMVTVDDYGYVTVQKILTK